MELYIYPDHNGVQKYLYTFPRLRSPPRCEMLHGLGHISCAVSPGAESSNAGPAGAFNHPTIRPFTNPETKHITIQPSTSPTRQSYNYQPMHTSTFSLSTIQTSKSNHPTIQLSYHSIIQPTSNQPSNPSTIRISNNPPASNANHTTIQLSNLQTV